MKPMLLNNQDIPTLIRIHPLNTVTSTKESNTKGHSRDRETQCLTKSMPDYLPKRMIKFTPLKNISISAIGSQHIHYENFNAMREMHKEKEKEKGNGIGFGKSNNDNDYLEFRTNYILKYAQNAELFYKTKQYVDFFDTHLKKNAALEYYNKIRKAFESFNRVLFNINPYSINANDSSNGNYTQWKQIIIENYEINNTLNRYLDLLFNELKSEKEANMKNRKKTFELNSILQEKETKLNQVDSYLNSFDVSNKIRLAKLKTDSIEDLKETFTQKENSYLLNIFRLEDEIRDLTSLLDKNKEYYQQYKNCQVMVDNKKREIEDMRVVYNKELNAKVIEIAILKDNEYALNTQVEELEEVKKTLSMEVEALKKENMEKKAQMIKMQMVINERTENINMVCEEMDTWMLELEDERNNHDNTTQALIALENRVMKEKEKEQPSNI